MDIQLKAVTRQNFSDVTDLRLLDHQRDYVASNAFSVAQASFNPQMQPRAMDEIRARGGVRRIWIAYQLDNTKARDLYAGLGFVETEADEDDEMYAVLEQ